MWGLSLSEPPHELLLDLSSGAAGPRGSPAGELRDVRPLGRAAARRAPRKHSFTVTFGGTIASRSPLRARAEERASFSWTGSSRAAEPPGTTSGRYSVSTCAAGSSRSRSSSRDHPGRLLARAGYPLQHMQPAIQALWSAYRLASPGRPDAPAHDPSSRPSGSCRAAVERAQGLTALVGACCDPGPVSRQHAPPSRRCSA